MSYRDYTCEAFLFVYVGDDIDNIDERKACSDLTDALIQAAKRGDVRTAITRPDLRKTVYRPFVSGCLLNSGNMFLPLDHVLLNNKVAEIALFFGDPSKLVSPVNLLLFKNDDVRALFTSHATYGYCKEAISYFGFPICKHTSPDTIRDRCKYLHDVIIDLKYDHPEITMPLLENLHDSILIEVKTNIDSSAITFVENICTFVAKATNEQLLTQVQVVVEQLSKLKKKLGNAKKRKLEDMGRQVSHEHTP